MFLLEKKSQRTRCVSARSFSSLILFCLCIPPLIYLYSKMSLEAPKSTMTNCAVEKGTETAGFLFSTAVRVTSYWWWGGKWTESTLSQCSLQYSSELTEDPGSRRPSSHTAQRKPGKCFVHHSAAEVWIGQKVLISFFLEQPPASRWLVTAGSVVIRLWMNNQKVRGSCPSTKTLIL